jgi:hypothetical protein
MDYKETYFGEIDEGRPHINTTLADFTKPQDELRGLEIPLYIYIISSLLNATIFIIGTFGNILVIVVVLKVRNMRTPTNVFLLNLSAADVLVLLVCQPAGLLEFFGKERWFLGKIMCKFLVNEYIFYMNFFSCRRKFWKFQNTKDNLESRYFFFLNRNLYLSKTCTLFIIFNVMFLYTVM